MSRLIPRSATAAALLAAVAGPLLAAGPPAFAAGTADRPPAQTRPLAARLAAQAAPPPAAPVGQARALLTRVSGAGALPGAVRVVRYAGVRLEVPAGWPVYQLATDPTRCVRFDVHAVYLGRQGPDPTCPAHAVGHVGAVQIVGYDAASARRLQLSPRTATLAGQPAQASPYAGQDHALTVGFPHSGAIVTVSYGADPGRAAQILGSTRPDPGAPPAQAGPSTPAVRAAPAALAQPAAVTYTGYGFDTCAAPSTASMDTWLANSAFRAVGIYVGGANRACGDGNLSAGWVSHVTASGWRLIPTYVGLQAPCVYQSGLATISTVLTVAAGQGSLAASDAVTRMQTFGLGPGNPVYFDMEAYDASNSGCVAAVNAFLNAWTQQLHRLGYVSGVYSSPINLRSVLSSSITMPDDVWYANWDGQASTTNDPYLPNYAWAYNQRIHQYWGGHTDTFGGVSINIDSDYLGGAVAPYVAPANPPASPSGVVATPQNLGATVSWIPPSNTGGAPLTSYTVTAQPGGAQVTVPGTATAATVGGLTAGTAYQFSVAAVNVAGPGPAGQSNPVVPYLPAVAAGYHPLTPVRILDTRIGLGAPQRPLAAWQALQLQVAGRYGIPADATAVVLNVVAVNPAGPGYLVDYRPGGTSGTNVWFWPGQVATNLTVPRIAADGTIVIQASTRTDVVADVQGYYAPGSGAGYQPVSPVRVTDTRIGLGGYVGPLPAGGTLRLPLAGRYGIPATARTVTVDVTAVAPAGPGWLGVFPAAPTGTSNLNLSAGATTTNLVVAQLAADGSASIHTSVATQLVVTVTGYYATGVGSSYDAGDVQRVLDTRIGLGSLPPVVPFGTITFPVAGVGRVPTGIRAVALDVTVVSPQSGGYLAVYPNGASFDTGMVFAPRQITTTLVIAPVAPDGTVTLRSSAVGQYVADVEGWYS